MEPIVLQDLAEAMWPLVATGAAERLGGVGTEETLRVLRRVRSQRRERGVAGDPASREELAEELQRLPASELQAAVSLVVNRFERRVDARRANFGIEIRR